MGTRRDREFTPDMSTVPDKLVIDRYGPSSDCRAHAEVQRAQGNVFSENYGGGKRRRARNKGYDNIISRLRDFSWIPVLGVVPGAVSATEREAFLPHFVLLTPEGAQDDLSHKMR